jgi:hypothetical protein
MTGKRRIAAGLWFLAIAPASLMACKCQLSLDVCAETLYSNVVFVGTVESIIPDFMTHWKPASREPIARINTALEQYLQDRNQARFSALREAVRSALPGLAPEDQRRLEGATSPQALVNLLAAVLDGSRRVRFHVRTLFRKADDDDKTDDDDDAVPDSLEVLTPFGDCGNDFQIGETYLVYANSDEESEVISTDVCSRTRRATDAGADLAYLSFYKDRENPAGRVQGFTTFDLEYQVHPHEPEQIALPAEGVIVELKSDRGVRYTAANPFGQFVFDGLDAGDYSLSAYAAGFPDTRKMLSGPRPLRLASRACSTQILLILKETP